MHVILSLHLIQVIQFCRRRERRSKLKSGLRYPGVDVDVNSFATTHLNQGVTSTFDL